MHYVCDGTKRSGITHLAFKLALPAASVLPRMLFPGEGGTLGITRHSGSLPLNESDPDLGYFRPKVSSSLGDMTLMNIFASIHIKI